MSRIQSVEATLPDYEVIQGAYAWCCAMMKGQPVKTADGNLEWMCDESWPTEIQEVKISLLFAEASEPIVDQKGERWIKFQELVRQWKEERGARSSITESAMLPAYQKIIGMGQAAVSLLLAQLESEGDQPDQWFWALMAITGQNPVKPEDQGNFRKMARAWIKWGKENTDAYV